MFQHETNVNIFDVVLFLLSSLATGSSFILISSLVLELWQFPFIRDWPGIRKSGIPPSELCQISGDLDKLGIPNLVRTSLTKRYWMLQNAKVTAFTNSELLTENQQWEGGGSKITPTPPTHIRVKIRKSVIFFNKTVEINIWKIKNIVKLSRSLSLYRDI